MHPKSKPKVKVTVRTAQMCVCVCVCVCAVLCRHCVHKARGEFYTKYSQK